jgi:hypothetical protein
MRFRSTNTQKDVLSYCDKLERALLFQSQQLIGELQACQSDNWNLQTELQNSDAQTERLIRENEAIRV